MASKTENDYMLKILILGDSSVGKTCLLLKFVDDKFSATHMPTIGIDFRSKIVEEDGKRVKVQLWDTAGQEKFRTLTNTLYNNVLGIVLCYSIDNRNSFTSIEQWMKQIKQNVGDDVAISLIGNKCDLPNRAVEKNEGEQLADSYNIPFYETSAKDGVNVNDLFQNLTRNILKNIKSNPKLYKSLDKQQGQTLTPQVQENKKEKGCC